MAKKNPSTSKKPKPEALPGMEDHAIRPLEQLAQEYAEIRDRRMELTQQEHALKLSAVKLMHKYEKTIYSHGGVTITLVQGDEDVKVRVKKADDDADDDGARDAGAEPIEFDAERRAAVDAEN